MTGRQNGFRGNVFGAGLAGRSRLRTRFAGDAIHALDTIANVDAAESETDTIDVTDAVARTALAGRTVSDTASIAENVLANVTVLRGAETQEVAGSDWTNPDDATGRRDGQSASIASDVALPKDGTLALSYAAFQSPSLVIVSVKMRFYVAQAGTATANGGLELYDGDTLLQAITGDQDALTAPIEFDRTSNYGTWASLDGLQAKVRFNVGLVTLGQVVARVDAVEVEVVARDA